MLACTLIAIAMPLASIRPSSSQATRVKEWSAPSPPSAGEYSRQGEEVVCRELPGLLPLVHVGVDARVDEGAHGLAEGVVIIGEAHAATIPTALP